MNLVHRLAGHLIYSVCDVFSSLCYSCCVQVLLPAASLLQLMDVRQLCCDFLQTQLHPTNCLGIRAFADLHACTGLLNQAHAYAGELSSFLSHCGMANSWSIKQPINILLR